MKLSQKAKYAGIGALAMTVAIPLVIKATDAVPLTFSQGDILSAEVLNTLFGRLNDVQKGFASADELVGSWTCVTKAVDPTCSVDGFNAVGYGIWKQKTQSIVFTCSGGTCQWTADTFFPGSCQNDFTSARQLTQKYDLSGNQIASEPPGLGYVYVHTYQKVSPSQFVWNISGYDGNLNGTITACTKQSQPPAPPATLSAAATRTSVALTWVDQSDDETGFKVQTKTEVGGTWTTLETTAAGIQTTTVVGTVGNNWYRVLATNANGDSITSNEILVVIE